MYAPTVTTMNNNNLQSVENCGLASTINNYQLIKVHTPAFRCGKKLTTFSYLVFVTVVKFDFSN